MWSGMWKEEHFPKDMRFKYEDTNEKYIPLNNLGEEYPNSAYSIHCSVYGDLGFEYGYAMYLRII
jgi:2-oxoglutarate dehydrogenase complex dehydrogenase (E1) component-like enzyme